VVTGGFEALWTIDLATNRVVGTATRLSGSSSDLALSPDGKLAYVLSNAPRGMNTLSLIDVATGSLIGDPIRVSGGSCDCPNSSLAITPDGKRAYVTNRGNALSHQPVGNVKVIDLVQHKVIGSPIETGPRPTAVVITRDGARAYVLNSGDGTISTIDLATNEITGAPISVGRHISVARLRLLALEQLRHLEAAVESVFDKDVAPRSGIKVIDFINNFGAGRRGGVKAEDIVIKIKELRELVEQPCPQCEEWPTGYNNGLTNRVLDLRHRLDSMMDDGFPTPAVGQPLIDVLTAVGMELGFW
jgi:YVTN family beta-propeller protein